MNSLYIVHHKNGKILGIFKDEHNAMMRAKRAIALSGWNLTGDDILIDKVESDFS